MCICNESIEDVRNRQDAKNDREIWTDAFAIREQEREDEFVEQRTKYFMLLKT